MATKDKLAQYSELLVTNQAGGSEGLKQKLLSMTEAEQARVLANLERTKQTVNALRQNTGNIQITSGYRTPEVNAAVGGKPNSQHIAGSAFDISVAGMTAQQRNALKEAAKRMGVTPIDEGDHLHMQLGSGGGAAKPAPASTSRLGPTPKHNWVNSTGLTFNHDAVEQSITDSILGNPTRLLTNDDLFTPTGHYTPPKTPTALVLPPVKPVAAKENPYDLSFLHRPPKEKPVDPLTGLSNLGTAAWQGLSGLGQAAVNPKTYSDLGNQFWGGLKTEFFDTPNAQRIALRKAKNISDYARAASAPSSGEAFVTGAVSNVWDIVNGALKIPNAIGDAWQGKKTPSKSIQLPSLPESFKKTMDKYPASATIGGLLPQVLASEVIIPKALPFLKGTATPLRLLPKKAVVKEVAKDIGRGLPVDFTTTPEGQDNSLQARLQNTGLGALATGALGSVVNTVKAEPPPVTKGVDAETTVTGSILPQAEAPPPLPALVRNNEAKAKLGNITSWNKTLPPPVVDELLNQLNTRWEKILEYDAVGKGKTVFEMPGSRVPLILENTKEAFEDAANKIREGKLTPSQLTKRLAPDGALLAENTAPKELSALDAFSKAKTIEELDQALQAHDFNAIQNPSKLYDYYSKRMEELSNPKVETPSVFANEDIPVTERLNAAESARHEPEYKDAFMIGGAHEGYLDLLRKDLDIDPEGYATQRALFAKELPLEHPTVQAALQNLPEGDQLIAKKLGDLAKQQSKASVVFFAEGAGASSGLNGLERTNFTPLSFTVNDAGSVFANGLNENGYYRSYQISANKNLPSAIYHIGRADGAGRVGYAPNVYYPSQKFNVAEQLNRKPSGIRSNNASLNGLIGEKTTSLVARAESENLAILAKKQELLSQIDPESRKIFSDMIAKDEALSPVDLETIRGKLKEHPELLNKFCEIFDFG